MRGLPTLRLRGIAATVVAAILLIGVWANPAVGQDLTEAEIRGRLIAAAIGIMAQHERLLEIEEDLAELADEEVLRLQRLTAARHRMVSLIGGLQRLSRTPPEVVFARPGAPIDTARTAMMLSSALPRLQQRVDDLQEQLTTLAAIREELAVRRSDAEAARDRLDLEIAALDALAAERRRLRPPEPVTEVTEAADLSELLDRLDRQAAAAEAPEDVPDPAADQEGQAQIVAAALAALAAQVPEDAPVPADPIILPVPPVPPATPAQADDDVPSTVGREPPADAPESSLLALAPLPTVAGVILPASGDIILSYGAADAFGEPTQGLTLSVYPGAPAVSPLDGVVRYAGPMRGYGDILIVEHADGYHSLITGLGRIDVGVGQPLLAGEPIGVTPLPQSIDSETPSLYFELRRDGSPVDPLIGLADAQGLNRG